MGFTVVRMRPQRTTLIGILALVVFGIALLAWFGPGLLVVFGMTPKPSTAPVREEPAVPVRLWRPVRETVAIVDTYAGMIEPLRRYDLGFEVAGRISRFGTNAEGQPLDEGDRVTKGTLLAALDDVKLRAQLDEAQAELERAQDRVNRNRALRERNAISDEEFRDGMTELALRSARVTLAEEALDDALLVAPADGVLSLRAVNRGESVSSEQTVFELLEVSEVVLAVGVPESRVLRLKEGMPATVELLGRSAQGRPPESLKGRIRRIGPSADESSGMFRVEVLLDNRAGRLRPGLVGRAHIVLDEIDAFRLRSDTAVLDEDRLYLYSVDDESIAQRHLLNGGIHQDGYLIIPELPKGAKNVVVRGQRRLTPGVRVEVVEEGPLELDEPGIELGIRTDSQA